MPYEVENASWSKDGKSIYFTANMGVHNEIMRVDVATRQVTQLTKGEHNLAAGRSRKTTALHVFTLQHRAAPERGLHDAGGRRANRSA